MIVHPFWEISSIHNIGDSLYGFLLKWCKSIFDHVGRHAIDINAVEIALNRDVLWRCSKRSACFDLND